LCWGVGEGWGMGWDEDSVRGLVIGHVADGFDSVVAEHRWSISYLLTGKRRQCGRGIPGGAREK